MSQYGMNMPSFRNGLCCLAAVLLAFNVLSVLDAGATSQRQALSGDVIKKIIPGAILQIDTPVGTVVPVSYGRDGTLAGRAGAVAFYLGSASDSGRWWVAGSKLCHKWKIWFKAEPQCILLQRRGARIAWRDDDGESGTATLIAARQLARPAPLGSPAAKRRRPVRVASPVRSRKLTPPASKRKTVRVSPVPGKRAARKPETKAAPARRLTIAQVLARSEGPKPPRTRVVTKRSPVVTTRSIAPPVQAARLAPTYRTVRMPVGDVLNIRVAPDATARIVGRIPRGAGGIQITNYCRGYWCPVVYRQHAGWVNRYYLAFDKPGALASRFLPYRVVRVRSDDVLNVRSAPISSAPVIAVIPPGASDVRLTHDCKIEWCRVAYRGRVGWAHRTYLAPKM